MICRVHRLTTDPADWSNFLRKFYIRLRHRGYPKQVLVPLFQAGLENRAKPPRGNDKTQEATTPTDTLFLHVPFHPANPPSSAIQEIFRDVLHYPRAATPLPQIENLHVGTPCGLKRLIIAYHRPPNLANLLCPRKFERTPGPPVSAHVRRDREGHCVCALGLPPKAAISSHNHNFRSKNPGSHDSPSPVLRPTDQSPTVDNLGHPSHPSDRPPQAQLWQATTNGPTNDFADEVKTKSLA
jgi:hypothetical protein